MNMNPTIIALVLSCSITCWGFVPPIASILDSIFGGRKPDNMKMVLSHKITLDNNEVIEINETIVTDYSKTPNGGKLYFQWSGKTPGNTLSAERKGKTYYLWLGGNTRIDSASDVVMTYLARYSVDDFKNTLVQEGFVKREQLDQYRKGFEPTGDPASWDIKNNYLQHPGIFLTRGLFGIAISVVGQQDDQQTRAISFDQAMKGIMRLEWKDNNVVKAWNFDRLSDYQNRGTLASHFYFEDQTIQRIESIVTSVEMIKKPPKEFALGNKERSPAEALSPTFLEALKVLLSYR